MTTSDSPRTRSNRCPSCNSDRLSKFYEVENVPVHSVLLVRTREAALSYPRGRICLGVCHNCGFIHNMDFNPALLSYNEEYEETQGFSDTFRRFHKSLAERLIERFDLRGRRVVEIGCGKGEFLSLLCELGENSGVGFDPSYVPGRFASQDNGRIAVVQDFYSERYRDYEADFYCCKMTLEHIPDTSVFLKTVRNNIGDRDAVVFFQVPDALRVFKDIAFWDVYYEHCSYFSAGSLARLFRHCGLKVMNVESDYEGQYLMITGCPAVSEHVPESEAAEEDIAEVIRAAEQFSVEAADHITRWRNYLSECSAGSKRVVLWGGGSKAVSFLTTLGDSTRIDYVVDINPFKQGTFLAGSGQLIVEPGFLREYNPDVVIAMNPVYLPEIANELGALELHPVLMAAEGATARFGGVSGQAVSSLRASA